MPFILSRYQDHTCEDNSQDRKIPLKMNLQASFAVVSRVHEQRGSDCVNSGMVMNRKATKHLSTIHLHAYELETAS